MWDQHELYGRALAVARIIPTYVGSTIRRASSATAFANHSHVCGINRDLASSPFVNAESFPRMWDQLAGSPISFIMPRIIPTYVGSTEGQSNASYVFPNHSHVCGINLVTNSKDGLLHESFPRMWDQRLDCRVLQLVARIIPTYVGSTAINDQNGYTDSNHSHVCGINLPLLEEA